MRISIVLLGLLITGSSVAQNTCYTDPHGKTLCSTPEAVVQGDTNSVGTSTYRDDRGNQLDFQTDQFGNASVTLESGKPIKWSAPVLGEKKYPFSETSRALPAPTLDLHRPAGSTSPLFNTPPGHPR